MKNNIASINLNYAKPINISALLFLLLMFSNCSKEDSGKEDLGFDPLESGYVSYFSFDNNLIDETGYTQTSTSNDFVQFTQGIKGQGLELNEDSNYIIYDKMKFTEGRKLSISLWFNSQDAPNILQVIWCSDFTISFRNNTAGLSISIPETKTAKGEFIINEWNHLVGTYDGNKIKCYLNGELVNTVDHSGELSDPERFLRIGVDGWYGKIDELYVYNSTLNSKQVKKLFEL